jgi:ABC-type antimicrobial peptide transport system permease subunit
VIYEVVGVVRDAKYQNLRANIMETIYICWAQRQTDYPGGYSYFARVGSGDPLRFAPAVDRLVRDVDSGLHVRNTTTYATLVGRTIVTERIMATLGGFFGVLALVIAGLGLFGVLAFQIARRTHEIGVRMALGAGRPAILGLVLRDIVWTVVGGMAIGAGAAVMLTGLASSFLFDLRPNDPGVFLVAGLILATVAVVAGWLPAHRASRVDPLVALRHE